ncbi:signal transduction histidine kinase [Leptolyngbya sp. Heron Island J]|uniref:CHASE domain-containing sensor histidine kinase n=1 Tax=Leptolyngbya sp. Heron Island J TaxID=1385935 RepID=UPI0003B988C9|nr:CHASE domain-containing protein [Leptolyngbya sp. Heron Island J]ESA36973.1 signal transduction histidine kinase [Leptolyngbya sp. Heron Island J]
MRRPPLPIVLTLLLGTGLSILAAFAVARWERANYRLQFQRQTDGLATALQRSVNRYTDLLLALGDFYTVSEQTISRTEFNRFVQRALNTYPGIQALEWAPIISEQTRTSFETAIQAEGYGEFQITERDSRGGLIRAASRPYYIPVTYLQPLAGNELAFGYDLMSDPTRLTALETARDTGQIAASGRIRLVQEHKNQFGFLVFLPLYNTSTVPGTQTLRQDQIQGYLLGVFRVSDVVEESLETLNYNIDFTLRDQSAAASEQFLGHYDAIAQVVTTAAVQQERQPDETVNEKLQCLTTTDCSHLLAVGGRQWIITFTPAANYPVLTPWRALSTLIIGFLITTIIARYLAQAQAELTRTRELSQVKIRLFSMASHELRTPLSTILLSAQALEAIPQDDNHHRIYSRIRAAAKRMNQLLNDLLTLSRAESGKLQFLPEIVNLQHYCQQLIEEVQFSFQTSPSIDLTVSGDCQKVYLDPHLLRAILTNLLSNAVKYSDSVPRVRLSLVCQPPTITFEIQDQGIGIPDADQGRLYEAFYRGANVGTVAGTGLGLSVVSACLQLHQGTLTFESQMGKGTTFRVILPYIE